MYMPVINILDQSTIQVLIKRKNPTLNPSTRISPWKEIRFKYFRNENPPPINFHRATFFFFFSLKPLIFFRPSPNNFPFIFVALIERWKFRSISKVAEKMGRDRHLLTEYFNRSEQREVSARCNAVNAEPSTYKSAVSRHRVIRLLHFNAKLYYNERYYLD